MRVLIAGALLATAAIAANVSLAEDSPAGGVVTADANLAVLADPCLPLEAPVDAAGAEPVAAADPYMAATECLDAGQGISQPVAVVLPPEPVVPQPIVVGPPPRNLTSDRIYRR